MRKTSALNKLNLVSQTLFPVFFFSTTDHIKEFQTVLPKSTVVEIIPAKTQKKWSYPFTQIAPKKV